MSYTDDMMQNLSFALRNTEGLKQQLNFFNQNAPIFERLAIAIEKQNELKEIELRMKMDEQGKKDSVYTMSLKKK